MPVSPTQAVLVAALLGALALVWYVEGRERWREIAAERLLFGVPWGTLVVVGVVLAFFLVAQQGLWHPSDPLALPFVSWSYFYPLGIATAGIAHGSVDHIVSNLTATLALAPIAEFAWGHYAGGRNATDPGDDTAHRPEGDQAPGTLRPDGTRAEAADETAPRTHPQQGAGGPRSDGGTPAGGRGDGEPAEDDGPNRDRGALETPWIRALVVFPAALLGAALLTSAFSLGPGLGFSGAVYAILGFAVVVHPLATLVGVLASASLGVLYDALTQPILRTTVEATTPAPPAWATVGFQAHALGFLLGVVAAVALLSARGRRPDATRVFLAALVVGLVQSLWVIATSSGNVHTLYRGAGVVAVVGVVLLVTLAAAGSDRALPRPLSALPWAPSRTTLAVAWLVLLTAVLVVFALGTLADPVGGAVTFLLAAVLVGLLAVPALLAVFPERVHGGPTTRRQAGLLALGGLAVLVALPGLLASLTVVAADPAPNDDGVTVGDYTVTYAENASVGRELVGVPAAADATGNDTDGSISGVIVVSEDRELWTVGARDRVLRFEGEGTVRVGGVGWSERIRAERTAWEVTGGETVYAVDLHHDGERTRAFASGPERASGAVGGAEVSVVPTRSGFELQVSREGSVVGTAPVPAAGESTTVGNVELTVEQADDASRIYAAAGDSRALVAVEETY